MMHWGDRLSDKDLERFIRNLWDTESSDKMRQYVIQVLRALIIKDLASANRYKAALRALGEDIIDDS